MILCKLVKEYYDQGYFVYSNQQMLWHHYLKLMDFSKYKTEDSIPKFIIYKHLRK